MRLALRKSAERIVHIAFNRYLYFGFIACLLLLKYLLRGEYAQSRGYAKFLDTTIMLSGIACFLVLFSLICCLATLKWMKDWGDGAELSWFKRIWRWNVASFVALPLVMYPGFFILVAGRDWHSLARLSVFCILPGLIFSTISRHFNPKPVPSETWLSTADNAEARKELIVSTLNKYSGKKPAAAKELGLSIAQLYLAMQELGMPYKS